MYFEVLLLRRPFYQVMDLRTFQIIVLTHTDTSIVVFFSIKNEDDQDSDWIRVNFLNEIILTVILWTVTKDFDEQNYYKKTKYFRKTCKIKFSFWEYWKYFSVWKFLLRKMFGLSSFAKSKMSIVYVPFLSSGKLIHISIPSGWRSRILGRLSIQFRQRIDTMTCDDGHVLTSLSTNRIAHMLPPQQPQGKSQRNI